MEEVVAIKVVDTKHASHFFLTWGRVFDAVAPEPLLRAVRRRLRQFGIEAVGRIRTCRTLQEAADQPYFYEALIYFSQQQVPRGKAYAAWKAKRRKQISAGKEVYYLGSHETQSS